MAVLTSFLPTGLTSPTGCQPEHRSDNGVKTAVGVAVATAAIATVVLVEVHNHRHTVQGCVTMGNDGLQVQDARDKKTYELVGMTTNVHAGSVIRMHGVKEKPAKDGNGELTFTVEKIGKDLGQCTAPAATP